MPSLVTTLRRTAASVCAALALASCDDYRSPTAPTSPPPTATPSPWLYGSWQLTQATPAGDCLADYLNLQGSNLNRSALLWFERDGDRVRLYFRAGPGSGSGAFWPGWYEGTLGAGGAITARVAAAAIGTQFFDNSEVLCYWQWSIQGGELSATLSADGRTLEGTIVESFRVENPPESTGATFTVRSHFTATAP